MTDPGPWRLSGDDLGLLRYIHPAMVAQNLQLPGSSGESRVARLRAVYEAIRQVGVGYADAVPGAPLGMQIIRPVDQVLWAPRHATCLDLALVFAGGCLKAGLHPVVVILDPPEDRGGVGHAVVLVWLDRDTTPRNNGHYTDDVWRQPPADVLDELQAALDGAGSMVAVDPNGMAVSLGTSPAPGLGVDVDTAVGNGARYLTGHRWRHGIDVGSAWHPSGSTTSVEHPTDEPIRAPYRHPNTAESPLQLLRAEYELTPFQSRDELVVLREWCQHVAAGDRTGLAVITGIGGSGKTRLALELAARMRRDGWAVQEHLRGK